MPPVATFFPARANADFLVMLGAVLLAVAAVVFVTLRIERRRARADSEAHPAGGPPLGTGAAPHEGDDAPR